MPGDLLYTFLRDNECCIAICIADTLGDHHFGKHISVFSDDIIYADSVSAVVTDVRGARRRWQRLVAIES